jgi:hypothetical protein
MYKVIPISQVANWEKKMADRRKLKMADRKINISWTETGRTTDCIPTEDLFAQRMYSGSLSRTKLIEL